MRAGNSFTYNGAGRLTQASDSSGNSMAIAYDPFNRPVSQTVNGVTTYQTYSGWNVIAEHRSGGTPLASYVPGAGNETLAQITTSGTNFYQHDALGSVTHVTDSTGALAEQYRYDAFGTARIMDGSGAVRTSSAIGNRVQFAGQRTLGVGGR